MTATSSASLSKSSGNKQRLYDWASWLGIRMNDKKNIITPFQNHGFSFLKMRIRLEESGKVSMRISKNGVKAVRRKLRIFRRWMENGTMQPEDVFISYQSWRAHAKRCHSHRTLHAMDVHFVRMYHEELRKRKRKFPCTCRAWMERDGWHYGGQEHEKRRHA